jgi:hypothetical protein
MSAFLRTIEFLCLGLWLGSDAFLSFVVAPGAFRLLASRDHAGAIVGYSLGRMHMIGIVCGVVFLVARMLRIRGATAIVAPAALCVILMLAVTAVSQFMVSPRMAVLRSQMGSIEATQTGSPLLAQFQRWHHVSVTLEGAVLLAGIVAIYFLVRELVVTG